MKSVKQIKEAFRGLEIPDEFKKHFSVEIATLEAHEKRNGNKLPLNNQTRASIGNLRKLYKQCSE